MAPSVKELNAVASVLESDHSGRTTRDVAADIIDALDKVRWAADKWVTVARIKLPGGDWHNFAVGPFTTLGQAQKAGESFLPSNLIHKRDGDGFFRAVPIVVSDKEAWNSIRPEHADQQAYIKESIERWDPWSWARAVAERDGWAHKPKAEKRQDKSEDHA